MSPAERRSWPVALSDAVYRRLLAVYPKAFRTRYGADMAQVFRDRAREVYRGRGAAGLLLLWVAALRDLVAAAVAERLVEERRMFRKIVTIATGLIVVGTIYIAIALPEFRYGLLQSGFNLVVYLPVFNLLILFCSLVHSFPLALVLVTLAFQLCLLPLTLRLLRDARALRALQPELRQLREQYRDDPAAWQAARRNLYRAQSILPGGVPLWLFLQNIFFYPVYGAFRTVLPRGAGDAVTQAEMTRFQVEHINSDLYPFVPHVSTLPNTHFLWSNLGTSDPLHILPVLAVVLTVLVLYLLIRDRATVGFTGLLGLLAAIVLTVDVVLGFPTLPAGIALSWDVSMLVAVAGYIALARRAPTDEGPMQRAAAGSAG